MRSTESAQSAFDLPRLPVLGVGSLSWRADVRQSSVIDGRPFILTTSGRAAILQALRAIGVGPGDGVFVPTYHCPTMVAPIVHLGARPRFYPIGSDGLPRAEALDLRWQTDVKAVLAAHWFGLPLDMTPLATWCRQRRVALIEDCAHAFFGTLRGQPIGHVGDMCVASLPKFLPVPEGGCLTGDPALVARVRLRRAGPIVQLRRLLDVFETAARYRRLGIFNTPTRAVFALKRRLRRGGAQPAGAVAPAAADAFEPLDELDCSRRPAWITEWILRRVDRGASVEARRRNYVRLAVALGNLDGGRPLRPVLPDGAVPYVFPLFVDQPERAYREMRSAGVPVFRWDRLWPATPESADDAGVLWARHVVQIACHQQIGDAELAWMADVVRNCVDGRTG